MGLKYCRDPNFWLKVVAFGILSIGLVVASVVKYEVDVAPTYLYGASHVIVSVMLAQFIFNGEISRLQTFYFDLLAALVAVHGVYLVVYKKTNYVPAVFAFATAVILIIDLLVRLLRRKKVVTEQQ